MSPWQGFGHIGGEEFLVCGQEDGQDGGIQGCGHMFMTDCVTVQPCGQRDDGHGEGHIVGVDAAVWGQNAGHPGGWHGCGQVGIIQFAGHIGGRQGEGHPKLGGCIGGGICCVSLLGEK